MKTFKIHLIRDGLTQGSVEGRYIGTTNEELSEQGKEQLEQLKRDSTYPEAQVVFCAPSARSRETCAAIYPDKQPSEIAEFSECNFGEFENHTAEELADNPAFAEWLRGDAAYAPPGGESSGEFTIRVCRGFIKLAEAMMSSGIGDTAVIAPGGVIMTIMTKFALPEFQMHDWITPGGCGFTLKTESILWHSGKKAELYAEIPQEPQGEYDDRAGWDWYPPVE